MLSSTSYASTRLGRRLLAVCTLVTIAGTAAACGSDDGGDGLTGPAAGVARGTSIFGLDNQNNLVVFGRGNPTREAARRIAVTGLTAGDRLVGIDFRANAGGVEDRRLYATSTGSRIYAIDTLSGAATVIGAAAFTPAIAGTSFGFDFNPRADRIRLHSNTDQDLRLNQLTGGVAAVDTMLTYQAGDVNAGRNPNIVGTAYTNPTPSATPTELYAIDSDLDVMTELPSPNSGRMVTNGALGVNTTADVGFDIAGDGTLFATLTLQGASRSTLYTLN